MYTNSLLHTRGLALWMETVYRLKKLKKQLKMDYVINIDGHQQMKTIDLA